MRRLILVLLIALMAVSCSTTQPEEENVILQSQDIVYQSEYEGLTFYLRNDHGSYTLSVPQQLAYFIPVEAAEDGTLTIPALGIVMKGKLPGRITYTQNGAELQLDFSIASLDGQDFFTRAQEKEIIPHSSEEHTVLLDDGGELSGSLILAGEKRADTVVLLISGSGIQDRYETIANHRPFYVLSEYIAAAGYDAFIYDDRGAGNSSEEPEGSDIYMLKDEAVQCFDYLTSLGYMDIVLLGHSQGGNIAAMLQCERNAKAVIMLASPAVTGLETVLDQNRIGLMLAGLSDAEIANAMLTLMQTFRYLLEGRSESAEALLADVFGAEAARAQIEELDTPAYLSYLRYDPVIYITHLRCPVLVLQGTYDTQVSAALNSLPMLSALQTSGQKYVYSELDGINHLMQRSDTGSIAEYGVIEETIAPEVLTAISQFLEENL